MNRILVVDDDTAIQLLYSDELTEEGYEVIPTGGGSELMELIEKKRPDLVVLGISEGEEVTLGRLQAIRNAYDDLPVVMSTAYLSFKYDMRSIAADEFVDRCSDLKELKRKIKKAFTSGESFPPETMFNALQREVVSMQNTL